MDAYHSQLVMFLFCGGWREILPTFLSPVSSENECYVFHWKTTELTAEEIQEDNEKIMWLGHMIA